MSGRSVSMISCQFNLLKKFRRNEIIIVKIEQFCENKTYNSRPFIHIFLRFLVPTDLNSFYTLYDPAKCQTYNSAMIVFCSWVMRVTICEALDKQITLHKP